MAIDATAVVQAAEGQWHWILQTMGIGDRFLVNRHGPCPVCGGTDRFRFDDKGRGLHFCSGCGAGDGVDLLRKFTGQGFRSVIDRLGELLGVATQEASNDPQKRAKRDLRSTLEAWWKESRPIRWPVESVQFGDDGADPASLYLASRQLVLPESARKVLRYHPGLIYADDAAGPAAARHPAMLAAIQGADGRMVALHRTYLSVDGRKAAVPEAKKTTRTLRSMSGAAIRLAPPVDGVLGVAEGIETALAVQQLYSVPTWATISAGGMSAFDWKGAGELRVLMVFADNDENFAGHAAAYALAHRAAKAGLTVNVILPDRIGEDFADQLERATA